MTVEPPANQQPQQPPGASAPPVYPGAPDTPAQPVNPAAPSGYGPSGTQPTATPSSGLSIAKNPLGLVSAIAGAAGILLGLLFSIIQFGIYAIRSVGSLGALSGVQTVLTVLLAICALVLGFLALRQREQPKILAAVGIALGGALLVEVLSSLVFTIGLPLLYR